MTWRKAIGAVFGGVHRGQGVAFALLCAGIGCVTASAKAGGHTDVSACIDAVSYWPLDAAQVGEDDRGLPALGTYERVSPDGRFVLRSFSGARLGEVSLIELPLEPQQVMRVYKTPLSNEAFPVQGSWRYLVDVDGRHFRFRDVLRKQQRWLRWQRWLCLAPVPKAPSGFWLG